MRAAHPPLPAALFDDGPFLPCPKPFNMAAHTLAAAERTPDKVALEVLRGPGDIALRLTYAELADAVLRTAAGLAGLGVGRGDRVLLRIGDSADFPVLFFAANAIGAVPVPTSTQLTEPELAGLVADVEPRLVCVGAGFTLPRGVAVDTLDADGIAALRRAGRAAGFAETAPDDPAYMLYTSGSSGRAKGVVHAQRAAWARRMMWDGWYGLTSGDRVLHAGALNWAYTLGAGLTDPWAAGATALVYAGAPDPHVWPALAARHGATIFAAAPGVYRQMLAAPGLAAGFAGLRHGLSAGEALPPALAAAWSGATGRPVFEAIGMTEISTYVSFSPTSAPRPGACGRPQPGRRVAILPETGETPAPRGVDGLLAVSRRDPGLMLGYWRQPRETAAAMRGEWFVTGDRARMEPDGTIVHLGRADDLMNAGGFRVSPVEVEAALLTHPGVAEAAAAEVPVRDGVSVIAAFYVPAADPLPDAELAAHCAARLARYKVPRVFRPIDALPRNARGKLSRGELLAAYQRQNDGASST